MIIWWLRLLLMRMIYDQVFTPPFVVIYSSYPFAWYFEILLLVSITLSSLLLFAFILTDFLGFVFHFARITIILSTGFHLKSVCQLFWTIVHIQSLTVSNYNWFCHFKWCWLLHGMLCSIEVYRLSKNQHLVHQFRIEICKTLLIFQKFLSSFCAHF